MGLYSRGLKTDAWNAARLLVALVVVSLALSWALDALQANDLEKVGRQVQGVREKNPLFLYYLLSVRVVAEEVFFRGFLVRKWGLWASSGAFALAHAFYGSLAEVLGAFVLGVLLAKAYTSYRNLLPNIFAHLAYNLAILKLLFGF